MSKITKAVRLQLAKMLQMYQEIKIDDGRTFSIEGDLAVGEEIFVANESGEFEPVPDGVYKTTDGQLITVEAGKVAVIEAAQPDPAADPNPSDPEPMADPEPDPDPAADPGDDPAKLKDRIAELENENANLKAKNAELEAKIAELEQLRKQSAANPIEGDPDPNEPKGNKFMAYAHKHQ